MARTKLTESAIKLIDGKNFANVAFVMEGGVPHVSPVWVDRDGDVVLINTTDTGRVKSKYLKPGSKVALSIFDQNNPYQTVLIQGKVVERSKTGANEHIDKMAKKYINVDKYPYHQPGIERTIIRIEPEKISKEMG
ncbi:MAG: pyridoxamine 5'-phosphate oxidase family protein [Nitrososphaerales archaeon]